MIKENTYVVIMAGGIGSRFWPASREARPKQFLDILGTGQTLLQMTYKRFQSVVPVSNILIVTNERYRELVVEQLPDILPSQVLAEPFGRNTAPCIAYATYRIMKKNPKATCIIAPSDHLILNETRFIELIEKAVPFAADDNRLITIGITPHKPETGYGYIQYIDSDQPFKQVKTFTEKPELDLAKKFLESGDFVWNAGIFIWSVSSITKSFEQLLPEVGEIFHELLPYYGTEKESDYVNHAYAQCKSISIDYGIMEKSENVFVIPGEFGWSDLGSWAALHEIVEKDTDNNFVSANALVIDTRDSIIRSDSNRLIVAEGLEGYLVVEQSNALLICKKDNERMFRQIYADVKKKKGNDYL